MKRLNIKHLILLFPFIFLIHDIEEIMTIEQFDLPFSITILSAEFTVAFSLLWLVVSIGCVRAARDKNFLGMKPITFFSFLVAGVFLANGIGHLTQAIYFQGYVQGLITAISVLLPFCLFSIRTLYTKGLITKKQISFYLVLGFLVQGPFALIALLFGKILV
jgi:hypothetical protein